jgi:Zn-dependent protease with chaperone function
LADFTAAKLMGSPTALISALSKIHESQTALSFAGSISTACLFTTVQKNRVSQIFNKQPTLEARIKALKEMN